MVIETLKLALTPQELDADTTIVPVVAVVKVPETIPVVGSKLVPAGMPLAPNVVGELVAVIW